MSGVRLLITLADGGLMVAYDAEFRLLVTGLKMLLEACRKEAPVVSSQMDVGKGAFRLRHCEN